MKGVRPMKILGQHILVEFLECSSAVLNSRKLIQQYMEEAAVRSNATIVNSSFHRFSPHGISGVVVIAESHLAIHTWPEYQYAAVDLFTCGTSVNPWIAFDVLKDKLQAGQFTTKDFKRGIPDLSGAADVHLEHKPAAAV